MAVFRPGFDAGISFRLGRVIIELKYAGKWLEKDWYMNTISAGIGGTM
ncbi:hypothetical protein K7I13_13825 [Brucepastera parasyntrophica]|nr:hypothetical protein [Brucepastera parasyntrophica]ULQ59528.1 hypothetical protein K7I13_13825 [Brucepastera parasyntrophica]